MSDTTIYSTGIIVPTGYSGTATWSHNIINDTSSVLFLVNGHQVTATTFPNPSALDMYELVDMNIYLKDAYIPILTTPTTLFNVYFSPDTGSTWFKKPTGILTNSAQDITITGVPKTADGWDSNWDWSGFTYTDISNIHLKVERKGTQLLYINSLKIEIFFKITPTNKVNVMNKLDLKGGSLTIK